MPETNQPFNELPEPQSNEEPYFLVEPCPCGGEECRSILFLMYRPLITEREGELFSFVQFPIESVPELINDLRARAAEMGVETE